jgi:L-ascorbate metabolism protein UlaG (beta-lactamase superfamily)
VRIELLGHACLRIGLADGRVVVIDPYAPGGLGGRMRYAAVPTRADFALITHEHGDHTDTSWLLGDFAVRRDAFDEGPGGVRVEVFHASHDEHQGRLRGGAVRMFAVVAGGVRLLHCGDLGERLEPARVAALGNVDVLVVPTGGYFTLGPEGATELVRRLAPRFVVPCHYETRATTGMGLLRVDAFARRHAGPIRRLRALDVMPGAASADTELVVLESLGLSEG